MGRSPCCEKLGLKKGPWTPEEDQKLLAYIQEHGHGNWRALPSKAGLERCGKSCRLRWTNYLRPDIKRGRFSIQEEQTIIQLHALLGNRWSSIATHLPKRTDNEIKNYWNTHLSKRLTKMGIDPVTHKPKIDALVPAAEGGPHQSKNVANLSHIAQWESARLEAEARLVRQSKLKSNSASSSANGHVIASARTHPTWQSVGAGIGIIGMDDSHSPTSTLSFMGNARVIEFMSHNGNLPNDNDSNYDLDHNQLMVKGEGEQLEWNPSLFTDKGIIDDDDDEKENRGFIEGFTELLLSTTTTTTTTTTISSASEKQSEVGHGTYGSSGATTNISESDYYEDSKNYWNSILNLVDSSPTHSSMF